MDNEYMVEWALDLLKNAPNYSPSELSNAIDTLEECNQGVYGGRSVNYRNPATVEG